MIGRVRWGDEAMALTNRDGNATYESRVLRTNWHYDSDYEWLVASVWDGDKVVEMAIDDRKPHDVDATPEVIEAARAWATERNIARIRADEVRCWEAIAERAIELRKGSRARVTRGRKVPIGTEGEIIWIGDGNYGTRCGLRDDGGEVYWTAFSNVTAIVDPDDIPALYRAPNDEVRAEARTAAERSWPMPKVAVAA
jgi:hypothetical protein